MRRRKPTARAPCTHEGCSEIGYFEYDNQRSYVKDTQRRERFKCVRHSTPGRLISTDNAETIEVLTATKSGEHLYWHDGKTLKSGQCHGDGYLAYAYDFPEGTQLTITATLKIPESPQHQKTQ